MREYYISGPLSPTACFRLTLFLNGEVTAEIFSRLIRQLELTREHLRIDEAGPSPSPAGEKE